MILPALLFTIGTAIGMIIGEDIAFDENISVSDIRVIGSANGDLARHTKMKPNGYPLFTQRTVIFEQVWESLCGKGNKRLTLLRSLMQTNSL